MLTLALVSMPGAMRHAAVHVGTSAPAVARSALLTRAATPLGRSAVARMMCDAAAEEAPDPEVGKASFSLLDVRVGKIVEAWEHPDSDKLWCEKIDVGEKDEEGNPVPREIASGLRAYYGTADELAGRKVLVVCNLKAAKLAGFESNGMVLCASSADRSTVAFVEPPDAAEPGDRVLMEGAEPVEPASGNAMKKKKHMEKAAKELRAIDNVACVAGVPLIVAGEKCLSPTVAAGTIN
jgi:aminoacyl tRNA synthase complex-interacting multifunctional protein 1